MSPPNDRDDLPDSEQDNHNQISILENNESSLAQVVSKLNPLAIQNSINHSLSNEQDQVDAKGQTDIISATNSNSEE